MILSDVIEKSEKEIITKRILSARGREYRKCRRAFIQGKKRRGWQYYINWRDQS